MANRIDSVAIFKRHTLSGKLLGLRKAGLYDLLLNVLITICYPLHLSAGILLCKSAKEIFSNLTLSIPCIGCSLKYLVYRNKQRQMQQFIDILQKLDTRVQLKAELLYFLRVVLRDVKRVFNVFLALYFGVSCGSLVILIRQDTRGLMATGWLPFDWNASNLKYACAIFYQFVGLCVQVWQNFGNDVYEPLVLCTFAGQVRLLALRVCEIGYDENLKEEYHLKELIACVKDYEKLMSAYSIVQDTVSWVLFIQFITSALNICITVFNLTFYVTDVLSQAYYGVQCFALLWELFPVCYYGSLLEQRFHEIPHAIFSSNWMAQSRSFRYNVICLTEMSLRTVTVWAAGVTRVHLYAFLATGKLICSLFTFLINTKKS